MVENGMVARMGMVVGVTLMSGSILVVAVAFILA